MKIVAHVAHVAQGNKGGFFVPQRDLSTQAKNAPRNGNPGNPFLTYQKPPRVPWTLLPCQGWTTARLWERIECSDPRCTIRSIHKDGAVVRMKPIHLNGHQTQATAKLVVSWHHCRTIACPEHGSMILAGQAKRAMQELGENIYLVELTTKEWNALRDRAKKKRVRLGKYLKVPTNGGNVAIFTAAPISLYKEPLRHVGAEAESVIQRTLAERPKDGRRPVPSPGWTLTGRSDARAKTGGFREQFNAGIAVGYDIAKLVGMNPTPLGEGGTRWETVVSGRDDPLLKAWSMRLGNSDPKKWKEVS